MKYCPKCGEKNEENVKFCSKCGSKITEEPIKEEKKKEGMGTASLVLGIISLILSFTCIVFLPIIIALPLSIIGLVLGIVNVAKKGKKFAGIILNSLALAFSLLLAFVVAPIVIGLGIFGAVLDEAEKDGSETGKYLNKFLNEVEREISSNYVEGSYNCKSFDGSGESDDYIVHFELNSDNTFLWGKYNDTTNNYVKGTYEFTDLHKTNNSNDYKYYNVKLDGEEYYNEGVKQNEEYSSEYEFGIASEYGKKQGILMNTRTYNMYYCYEE